METAVNSVPKQLAPYAFKPGESGNPNGRPKGSISIKDKVRQYLEEHPEAMTQVVGHFVHKNRELMWQMLEGSPNAKTDITSAGKPLSVNLVQFSDPDNSAQLPTHNE